MQPTSASQKVTKDGASIPVAKDIACSLVVPELCPGVAFSWSTMNNNYDVRKMQQNFSSSLVTAHREHHKGGLSVAFLLKTYKQKLESAAEQDLPDYLSKIGLPEREVEVPWKTLVAEVAVCLDNFLEPESKMGRNVQRVIKPVQQDYFYARENLKQEIEGLEIVEESEEKIGKDDEDGQKLHAAYKDGRKKIRASVKKKLESLPDGGEGGAMVCGEQPRQFPELAKMVTGKGGAAGSREDPRTTFCGPIKPPRYRTFSTIEEVFS